MGPFHLDLATLVCLTCGSALMSMQKNFCHRCWLLLFCRRSTFCQESIHGDSVLPLLTRNTANLDEKGFTGPARHVVFIVYRN